MSKYWQIIVEPGVGRDTFGSDTWIVKRLEADWSTDNGCLAIYDACFEYIAADDKSAWQLCHIYAPGTWQSAEIQPYEEDEDE